MTCHAKYQSLSKLKLLPSTGVQGVTGVTGVTEVTCTVNRVTECKSER